MCASILLIACSEGGDMPQDRSTGWRLGTSRIVQFRYQVIGIAMGAVLAVTAGRRFFMSAYPVLKVDQFGHHVEGAQRWQSAMTYKFVGALRGITNAKGYCDDGVATRQSPSVWPPRSCESCSRPTPPTNASSREAAWDLRRIFLRRCRGAAQPVRVVVWAASWS